MCPAGRARPGAGGRPEIIFDRGHVVDEGELCGIPVQFDATWNFIYHHFKDDSGDIYRWVGPGNSSAEFTSQITGKVVVITSAGGYHARRVDNPDGTVTFFERAIGVTVAVRGARGVHMRDAGVFAFTTTIDPATGEATTVFEIKGPHPGAESDYALLCETVITALT